MKTSENLRQVATRPAWSKEILLWIGRDNKLDALLAGQPQKTLDLLDLFDEDETLPADDDDRRAELESRLETHLRGLRNSNRGRLVLRVKNAALLARYGVNLQSFFDYFSGARTMVVLCLEGAMAVGNWQTHLEQQIEYDSNAVIRYLSSCLADPTSVYRESLQ